MFLSISSPPYRWKASTSQADHDTHTTQHAFSIGLALSPVQLFYLAVMCPTDPGGEPLQPETLFPTIRKDSAY